MTRTARVLALASLGALVACRPAAPLAGNEAAPAPPKAAGFPHVRLGARRPHAAPVRPGEGHR